MKTITRTIVRHLKTRISDDKLISNFIFYQGFYSPGSCLQLPVSLTSVTCRVSLYYCCPFNRQKGINYVTKISRLRYIARLCLHFPMYWIGCLRTLSLAYIYIYIYIYSLGASGTSHTLAPRAFPRTQYLIWTIFLLHIVQWCEIIKRIVYV